MENKDTHKENAAKEESRADGAPQGEGGLSKKPESAGKTLSRKLDELVGHKKPAQKGEEAPVSPSGQKEEYAGLSATLSALSDQMLRLQAEFDNYKKRTAKEKEQLAHNAEGKLMLRMLPVYEEIRMAEAEAGKLSDEAVKKGILLVLGKLQGSFEKEGLQEMKLEGEKSDPFRHETAMREDSDAPEGTIVRAIQKGYLFRGEVLRHAIVSVSSGKKPEEKDEKK